MVSGPSKKTKCKRKVWNTRKVSYFMRTYSIHLLRPFLRMYLPGPFTLWFLGTLHICMGGTCYMHLTFLKPSCNRNDYLLPLWTTYPHFLEVVSPFEFGTNCGFVDAWIYSTSKLLHDQDYISRFNCAPGSPYITCISFTSTCSKKSQLCLWRLRCKTHYEAVCKLLFCPYI